MNLVTYLLFCMREFFGIGLGGKPQLNSKEFFIGFFMCIFSFTVFLAFTIFFERIINGLVILVYSIGSTVGFLLIISLTMIVYENIFLKNEKVQKTKDNNLKDNVKVIKNPTKVRVVMWFISCFAFIFIPVMYFALFETARVWLFVILWVLLFCLPSFIFAISWSIWKLEVSKDYFIYRNYFGNTQKYYFKDLKEDINKELTKWYLVKNGKRVICLESSLFDDSDYLQTAYYNFKEKKN